MSALQYAVADSATMLRRNLKHLLRYPALTIGTLSMPIVILLLFVGLLGRTLGNGIGVGQSGITYIDYVAPGIILMSIAAGVVAPSVSVATDMTEGVVDRFRTMAIWRPSLLAGHVLSSLIQSTVSTVLVMAVSVALGWRPQAGPLAWLAAAGLLELLSCALIWIAVGIGLTARSVESSSNTPLLIQFLPFLSSTFVPTGSMPAGVRWFAEYQPFTPLTETLRGLLSGTGEPVAHNALVSVCWCLGLTAAGYWWSLASFEKVRAA